MHLHAEDNLEEMTGALSSKRLIVVATCAPNGETWSGKKVTPRGVHLSFNDQPLSAEHTNRKLLHKKQGHNRITCITFTYAVWTTPILPH